MLNKAEADAKLFNSDDENYSLTQSEIDTIFKVFYETRGRQPLKEELKDIIEAKINSKMSETLSDNKAARGKMINWVENQPHYTQCILHIEAYRNYHKAEKEEFAKSIPNDGWK